MLVISALFPAEKERVSIGSDALPETHAGSCPYRSARKWPFPPWLTAVAEAGPAEKSESRYKESCARGAILFCRKSLPKIS